eukprot:CAMPEP_0176399316 /NCGR_PEP_ID=MMETSP0126-20121128/46664_1 /TAXON_ID=141414 ORGANISM="Strombidinopsis acuminatum, Strain SPMC142" /NCGR_SAMPLE_ID=MMETSP0126 /ASSEMBLY_ACC=CAM_ASM_000229 /LENGTH=50 /DNA_ID=CAMNT_0017774827 /DNA_START=20 /DNA_END=172 /DNA_ORIENTATION=-
MPSNDGTTKEEDREVRIKIDSKNWVIKRKFRLEMDPENITNIENYQKKYD